jgi:hypothetical protein
MATSSARRLTSLMLLGKGAKRRPGTVAASITSIDRHSTHKLLGGRLGREPVHPHCIQVDR